MIHIGLCDDDAGARFTLQYMLERHLEAEGREPICYSFSSGEGLLKWLVKHAGELDVLFLDIEMPGLNGMETARQIRKQDENLMLVFVTGFADYVFDGYLVNALDYLLKPVDPRRLSAVLKRVMGVLALRAPDNFSFKSAEGIFRVAKNDILYLQSEGRKIHLRTSNRTFTFYEKLDVLEAELGSNFVRIHQRYLVRCGGVSSFEGDHLTIGPHTLPVSRSHRNGTMLVLSGHLLGGEKS